MTFMVAFIALILTCLILKEAREDMKDPNFNPEPRHDDTICFFDGDDFTVFN